MAKIKINKMDAGGPLNKVDYNYYSGKGLKYKKFNPLNDNPGYYNFADQDKTQNNNGKSINIDLNDAIRDRSIPINNMKPNFNSTKLGTNIDGYNTFLLSDNYNRVNQGSADSFSMNEFNNDLRSDLDLSTFNPTRNIASDQTFIDNNNRIEGVGLAQSSNAPTTNLTESDIPNAGSPRSYNESNFDYSKLASAARYAPAIGSAATLMFEDYTPEKESYQRMASPEQLQPQQISESQFDPLFNSQYNKTVGDIINTSGGSGAAARANIQGAGITNARNKASVISDIIKYNQQNKQSTDQFNIGNKQQVNQMNTQISNQETMANAQNRAAARSQKAADWANLFNSLGAIGTETFRAKAAEKGFGYNPYTGEKP